MSKFISLTLSVFMFAGLASANESRCLDLFDQGELLLSQHRKHNGTEVNLLIALRSDLRDLQCELLEKGRFDKLVAHTQYVAEFSELEDQIERVTPENIIKVIDEVASKIAVLTTDLNANENLSSDAKRDLVARFDTIMNRALSLRSGQHAQVDVLPGLSYWTYAGLAAIPVTLLGFLVWQKHAALGRLQETANMAIDDRDRAEAILDQVQRFANRRGNVRIGELRDILNG